MAHFVHLLVAMAVIDGPHPRAAKAQAFGWLDDLAPRPEGWGWLQRYTLWKDGNGLG